MSEQLQDSSVNEQSQIIALLQQISQDTAHQNEQLKRQLRMTRLVALFCACLAVVAVFACASLLPHITNVLSQANTVLVELETTAKTVNETIPNTMQDVNSLIAQSRMGIDTALVSIQTALGKINDIDIDSLNQAIADLAGIVRPLSALLGRR
ncbi:MAG: hypothetical protein HFG17_07185 [Oscillospiraceae bacterium]|nr:hypothetical protein [Oscillospiraceae bacterium]